MKVNNPIFRVDMPDPDVIRVVDTYYMVSTTMFFMPGGAILKSKDLVNWEPCSYIFETIENNDIYELKNKKNAYGKGQWATSLIFHNDMFYACFVCHDLQKTFIYYTDDIEKTGWNRYVINDVFHDMSFLFVDEIPYLIYGNGTIYAVELNKDLSGVKDGGFHDVILETPKEGMWLRCEGCRAYIRNGYIYLSFIDIPDDVVGNGQRRQICYRSKTLTGPYERKIILDDDFSLNKRGIAQGPFIVDEKNNGYAMLFQDRASAGRMPFLMPLKWENDWPVLGDDSNVPELFETCFDGYQSNDTKFITSDTFNHDENKLDICWQWNHNPINNCWSFTDNPGHLRLTVGQLSDNLLEARNTLTQRTMEPYSEFTVELDAKGLKNGDYAGLTAFMSQYGQIGLYKKDDVIFKKYVRRDKDYKLTEVVEKCGTDDVSLKIVFDFTDFKDIAMFYIREDGNEWKQFGETLHMEYTLDLFVGYRIGLFCYGEESLGGYADFADFTFA